MAATRELDLADLVDIVDDAAALLEFARAQRRAADRAEADLLGAAVAWAHRHPGAAVVTEADWEQPIGGPGGERSLPLAGPGTPDVAEFCIAEFALAAGMNTDAGRRYLGDALEVFHRLPRVWARVQDGSLPVWRARRVAASTRTLPAEAAGFVDRQVAGVAHRIGLTGLDRLVEEARVRFDPGTAAALAAAAAEQRHASVHTDQVGFQGTVEMTATVDLADALDLEDALRAGAAELAEQGCTDSLPVRRARALGLLARGQLTRDHQPTQRRITLHLHATPHQRRGDGVRAGAGRGDRVLRADRPARRLVCRPGHPARRPAGHRPGRPHRCRGLRGPRPARHRDPAAEPHLCLPRLHPPRPGLRLRPRHRLRPGRTDLRCNIAPLCRGHHRLKTHGGWTYTKLDPTTYLWRSPHGHHYLRDHHGTSRASPDP